MAFLVFGVFVVARVAFIPGVAAETQVFGLGFRGEDVAGAGEEGVGGGGVAVGLWG